MVMLCQPCMEPDVVSTGRSIDTTLCAPCPPPLPLVDVEEIVIPRVIEQPFTPQPIEEICVPCPVPEATIDAHIPQNSINTVKIGLDTKNYLIFVATTRVCII